VNALLGKGCHSNTFCTTICDCGQMTGQWSKAKDNGQTFLVDSQSYTNKVVHENIAKINGIRSEVKIKFSMVKAENRSRSTLTAVADCSTEAIGVTLPCDCFIRVSRSYISIGGRLLTNF